MKKLILFTLDGCPACIELKNTLNQMELPFLDVEVNLNPDIWKEVESQIGESYLPAIYIVDEDNENQGTIFVADKDFNSTKEAMDIIREHFLTNI